MTLKDSLTIAGGRGVWWGVGEWLGNLKSWGQVIGKLPWIWTLESSCYYCWSVVPVSLGVSEQRKAFTPLRLTPWCLLFGRSVVSDALWPRGLQHARCPCLSLSPKVCSDSRPLSWWCHPTISSSVAHSPALNPSQHQGLFQWIGSLNQVAKVMELQLQHQSFQWIFRTDLL